MHEADLWDPPGPQRDEERHAVEDLDDPVGGAEPTAPLVEDGAGEHAEAPAAAHDPNARPAATSSGAPRTRPVCRVTSSPAAARCRHISAAWTSEPPGLGVVLVPEGQQVHPPDPRACRALGHRAVGGPTGEVGGGDGAGHGGRARLAVADCGPTGGSLIYAPLWMP